MRMLHSFLSPLGLTSCALTKLREPLNAWCKSYVTAFSTYDSPAIARHWSFPSLIVAGQRNLTFRSADDFNKNTEGLLRFYRKVGIARANRKLVDVLQMGQGTASITVIDEMVDAGGAQIVTWQAAYVLRNYKGVWLAVMANADGETAAWEARGTPLGS